MKRKVLFIINPISGGKRKDQVPALIQQHLDTTIFEPTIAFTEGALHASQLAKDAIGKYQYVVAVGGDGTINEVASSVVGTDVALGIIPFGSGNGLARFLNIPMNTTEAIKTINSERVELIDSGTLNGQCFFNMAGMGFDAHISEVFSHDKTRGFGAYIKSAFREIRQYQSDTYDLKIDGKSYRFDAFMLSFANSSQYGNNAHVSPLASVQDGLLDVCIIKPFPLYKFPAMGIHMFAKTAHRSKYVEIIRGKNIMVNRSKSAPAHLDGEPQFLGTSIEINIVPQSLKIIAGKAFKTK